VKYVCDAPGGRTWFRLESEAEALKESELMSHAVEKHFRREREKAAQTYQPTAARFIERDIGLAGHIERAMPIFVTLRDEHGAALVTAMLPPGGKEDPGFRPIVVGPHNRDPYPQHEDAIAALARHFGITLEADRCYPYRRD
jgi:hypothetical protein